MNEICYEKAADFAREHQMSCSYTQGHSENRTCVERHGSEKDEIDVFVSDGDAAVREILRTVSENANHAD